MGSGWQRDGECRAFRLATFHLCGVLLNLLGTFAAASVASYFVATALRCAAIEEAKDAELSEEFCAAACASASYCVSAEDRLAELHARGVESRNWRVDRQLSTITVAVFYNWYTQALWVAFRGTWSVEDWASNLASILPGEEMRDERFIENLALARAAQRKYVLFKSIRLTGHSRGGNMADLFGRKLGLRSIQINPATWGKIFREQEPAVESITARSADLVSVLETFSRHNRQVYFRWPKGATPLLIACCALFLCRSLLHTLAKSGASTVATQMLWALLGLLNLLWVVAVVVYFIWMHSVTRFTKR